MEEATNGAAGMFGLGLVCILTGGVGVGFGSSFFTNGAGLSALGSAWAAGDGSGNSLAITLAPVATGCAAGAVVAGVIGIVSNQKKSRGMAIATIVLVVVLSAVEIVGGLFFQQLISRSYSILNDPDLGEKFSSDQRAMNDLSAAVHKNCCYDKVMNNAKANPYNEVLQQFSKEVQAPTPLCPIDESSCTQSIPAKLLEKFQDLEDFTKQVPKLCSCYKQAVYDKIEEHVLTGDTCASFQEVYVEIPNEIKIPTINPSLDINTVIETANAAYSDYTPIPALRMTGELAPRDPAFVKSTENGKNYTLTPKDQGVPGWACGFGYVKGISWIVNLYLEHVGATASLVLMICGGAQIFGVILVLAYWMIGGGKPSEEWASYDNGVVSPKTQF